MTTKTLKISAATLITALALSACGTTSASAKPKVVASFYPLQYLAQRIAGDNAEITNLTAPGAEPHDLELTAQQTAKVGGADVVIYEAGLQPSVDQAVKNGSPKASVDAAKVVSLAAAPASVEGTSDNKDPHFWQDPTLYSQVADSVEAALAKADPGHASTYSANLASLKADLAALDADITKGLANCAVKTLVVSHDAFEYFGRRYHLTIAPIAGLSPDAEPSAQHLQELSDLAKNAHITTIFSEKLASPKQSQTLAADLHIQTAVLDPLEGLEPGESGDYLTLMRGNLAAIQKASSCQ